MYRVILVDDEPWILQGICESFPWAEYGMEVAGSFTKASLALDEILRSKPDVVFSDIRMPGISGIDLMHTIREQGLDTEIVIISGFSQFEYAREAIRMGAFDYCLKPIDEEATGDLLARLKERLDRKEAVKNSRLIELLADIDHAEHNPAYASIPRVHAKYQMLQLVDGEHAEVSLSDYFPSRQLDYVSFHMAGDRYYLVNTDEDLYELIENDGITSSPPPGDHTMGISGLADSIRDISALSSESMVACRMRFITGKEGVYRYHAKRYAMLAPMIKRTSRLVDDGKTVEFRTLIEALPEHFSSNGFTVEDLCYVWNQLAIYAEGRFPEKTKYSGLTILEWREITEKFNDMEDFCQTLLNEFQFCSGTIGKKDGNLDTNESNFGKMVQFLNEHYNEQIKLKDLAKQFYINKNYACFLFKKHTDMTYSEYLNTIRMNKARELLVDTSLSIAEVSERSGYSDYFYFSKLFKRIYGMTPAQFRKQPLQIQTEGDAVR